MTIGGHICPQKAPHIEGFFYTGCREKIEQKTENSMNNRVHKKKTMTETA